MLLCVDTLGCSHLVKQPITCDSSITDHTWWTKVTDDASSQSHLLLHFPSTLAAFVSESERLFDFSGSYEGPTLEASSAQALTFLFKTLGYPVPCLYYGNCGVGGR